MSDRFCPSCGRGLPWDWNGKVAPSCFEVPDAYGRVPVQHIDNQFPTCREHAAAEWKADQEEQRKEG